VGAAHISRGAKNIRYEGLIHTHPLSICDWAPDKSKIYYFPDHQPSDQDIWLTKIFPEVWVVPPKYLIDNNSHLPRIVYSSQYNSWFNIELNGVYPTNSTPNMVNTYSQITIGTIPNDARGFEKDIVNALKPITIPAWAISVKNWIYVPSTLFSYATLCDDEGLLMSFANDTNIQISITGYSGEDDLVPIPASIDGMIVNDIADYAFEGSEVSSVIVPEGVTSIGEYSFSQCDNLQSILLPDTLESIGENAFKCSDDLTAFVYPGSLAEDYMMSKGIPYDYTDEWTNWNELFEYNSWDEWDVRDDFDEQDESDEVEEWDETDEWDEWDDLGEWDDNPTTISGDGVVITPSSLSIKIGDTRHLTVTVPPTDDTYKTINYTSSNTDVAVVDVNGKITAKSPGSAVIIVATEDGEETAACSVTVTQSPATSSSHTFTVGAWNISGATANATLDTIGKLIKDQDAKLIGAQYVRTAANANRIAAAAGLSIRHLQTISNQGHAILSDWPVVSETSWNLPNANGWEARKLHRVVYRLPDGQLLSFYNTHLDHHVDRTLLTSQMTFIAAQMVSDSNPYKILSGCFNTSTLTDLWSIFTGKGFVTANGTSAMNIVVSSNIRISQNWTATSVTSVHPIFAKLEIRPVSSVTVSPNSVILMPDQISQLIATVFPSDALNKEVTWGSDNPSIATVDQNGLVTAVNSGIAMITVKTVDENRIALCDITVPEPEQDDFEEPGPEDPGDSDDLIDLNDPGKPEDLYNYPTDGEFAYYTSVFYAAYYLHMNPDVEAAFGVGNYAAALQHFINNGMGEGRVSHPDWNVHVYKENYADLQSAFGSDLRKYYMHFLDYGFAEGRVGKPLSVPVTAVTLATASASLTVGGTQQLVATVLPSEATNSGVNWSSGNTSVATVGADGKVVAVGSGSAVITVVTADGGFKATCTVTVAPLTVDVTGITLTPTTANLSIGGSQRLTTTVTPLNATNRTILWTSSNTAVATIDTNGKVVAVGLGIATITATTADSGFKATCTVTVTQPVTGVTVSIAKKDLCVGDVTQLTATIAPSNASNKAVTWASSNTAIATVDTDGKVTCKASGTVTFTAQTSDGGKTATVTANVFGTVSNSWNSTTCTARFTTSGCVTLPTGKSWGYIIVRLDSFKCAVTGASFKMTVTPTDASGNIVGDTATINGTQVGQQFWVPITKPTTSKVHLRITNENGGKNMETKATYWGLYK